MSILSKTPSLLAVAIMWRAAMADPLNSSAGYIENFSCDHGPFALQLPPDARLLSQLGPVVQRHDGEVEEWGNCRTTRHYV